MLDVSFISLNLNTVVLLPYLSSRYFLHAMGHKMEHLRSGAVAEHAFDSNRFRSKPGALCYAFIVRRHEAFELFRIYVFQFLLCSSCFCSAFATFRLNRYCYCSFSTRIHIMDFLILLIQRENGGEKIKLFILDFLICWSWCGVVRIKS